MRAPVVIALVAVGGALVAGCEAIDNFNPFHIVGGDGAAPPDGGAPADAFAAAPDLALADLIPSPDMTALPGSCLEIRAANPNATDGRFTLYLNADPAKPWTAYCRDLAGQPKEYLSLVMAGPALNFSQYTAGGVTPGTNVRTSYTRVRFDPKTLLVDVNDQTFTTSTGMLDGPQHVAVISMPFAAAMNCLDPVAASGVGNVDFRGTPFAVIPNSFALGGNAPAGSAAYSLGDQVVDLSGGGYCGWMAPVMSQPPLNMAGAAPLPLRYLVAGPVLDAGEPPADLAGADLAPLCVPSLANVGTGDFTIAFTVSTAQGLNTQQPLLNQRTTCDVTHSFWAVFAEPNGAVSIETGGPVGGNVKLASNSPITDGKMHRVTVTRRAAMGGLVIAIDGFGDAGPLPSATVLDNGLPPVETAKETACNIAAQGVNVAGVCLTIP